MLGQDILHFNSNSQKDMEFQAECKVAKFHPLLLNLKI